ncbi:hypothetical protein GQ457_02G032420 [Hibiscus cannabinus]
MNRGVILENLNQECPWCGMEIEDAFHLFADCNFIKKFWDLFGGWWNSRICSISTIEDLFGLCFPISFSGNGKMAWGFAVAAALWSIWTARNDRVFRGGSMNQKDILLHTKMRALIWIKNGNSNLQLCEDVWWEDPSSAIIPAKGMRSLNGYLQKKEVSSLM